MVLSYCRRVPAAEDQTGSPSALLAAAALLGVQALALTGIALFLAVRAFGSDVTNRGLALLAALTTLVGGAVFALLARGTLRRRSRVRAPALVLELLCLPVGWGLFQGHKWGYGLPLVVVAVAVLLALGAAGMLTRQP